MDKFIKVKCKNCSKIFLKDEGHYNENLKLRHNFYCSRKCESKYKTRKRRILKCENCGKEFSRTISAISPHNYCSCFCAAMINNRNRPERRAKTIKCKNCGKKFKKWALGNKKYCSKIKKDASQTGGFQRCRQSLCQIFWLMEQRCRRRWLPAKSFT